MRKQLSYILLTAALLAACVDKPEVPEPQDGRSLGLSSLEITLGGQESAFSIEVTANFAYTVDIRADWIHEDPARSSTEFIRYFVADENTAPGPREGDIRFADKDDRYYYKTVKVVQEASETARRTLYIVDKDATAETKALLANLWTVAEKGWMFGHHDDLWYGRYWYNNAGESDTKAVCGDYPAVFSVDFAELMDNRYNSSSSNAIRRRVILEARERGEVIMACAHLNNPLTGGDSWDNSSQEVVRGILTQGSAVRTKYLTWLDRCADFANNLKDARGNLIPVIFRMYHEHTQGWSWWGSSCSTESDFIALWRFTVQYLRDTKGVHNFLYAISPQMDEIYSNARNRLLYRLSPLAGGRVGGLRGNGLLPRHLGPGLHLQPPGAGKGVPGQEKALRRHGNRQGVLHGDGLLDPSHPLSSGGPAGEHGHPVEKQIRGLRRVRQALLQRVSRPSFGR